MPREPFAIDEHPQEAESQRGPGEQGGGEACERITPAQRIAVATLDAQRPRAHAERLAAVHPEAREEQESEHGEQGPIDRLTGPDGFAARDRQERGGHEQREREVEQ